LINFKLEIGVGFENYLTTIGWVSEELYEYPKIIQLIHFKYSSYNKYPSSNCRTSY